MESREFNLHDGKTGSALAIRVTPRSSRNEIVEILADGTVKIHLKMGEGQANDALVDFLSQVLGIPRAQIEVVAGETGRDKLVSILDLDAKTVHARILRHLS